MSKKTIASDSNENRNHLCNKKGSTPTHCRVSKKLLAMYEEECGETLSMTQLYKTICSLTKSEIELLTKKSKKWRPNFFKLQLDISDKDLSDKVDISIRKSVSDTKHTVVNLPQSVDILSLYHKEVFQMNAKFTDDEWLLIFQQRTQSGLSVRKWCDSNQISYDKYKYWEKKLLRRSDPERAVSPMDFVELPQALLPPLSLEQEQSYPFELSFHGLHLKIASHAQLSQLAGILKILQASC